MELARMHADGCIEMSVIGLSYVNINLSSVKNTMKSRNWKFYFLFQHNLLHGVRSENDLEGNCDIDEY